MSAPTSPANNDERIQEEAARWFARKRSDEASPADHAAFAVWLEADPRHRREFAILETMWDTSARLRPRAAGPARKRGLPAVAALAGAALLAAWLIQARTDEALVTGAGERRHLQLADGSELDMAPGTRLNVHYRWSERRLELERGQIAIAVAGRSLRPLVVAAGGGLIRDIGTRFEVTVEQDRTHVAVAEGVVEISLAGDATAQRVGAGEGVEFGANAVSAPKPEDVAASLAWTRGQLAFDAEPLNRVVTALNRYRKKPIVISEPELGDIRLSGVFLIDDEEGTTRAIGQVAPVDFVAQTNRVEMRSRR